MRRGFAKAATVAATLLWASAAVGAVKLPVVADEALSSAERLLNKKTGDERKFACIDAVPFLAIVYENVPDYAYSTGLYAECLFLVEDWAKAEKLLEKYLGLVPEEARKGAVLEKVERAKDRLRYARKMQGKAFEEPVAAPEPPAPVKPPEPEKPPEPVKPAPKAEAPKAVENPVVATPPPESPKPAKQEATAEFTLPPDEPAPKPGKPPSAPWAKQLGVRGGLGPLAGGFGLALEGRYGPVGLVVGTGGYPFAAGLSFAMPDGQGGLYGDLHLLRDASGPFVKREHAVMAFGATAGFDWRFGMLSVKTGAGFGYSAFLGTVVAIDLQAGVVLSI